MEQRDKSLAVGTIIMVVVGGIIGGGAAALNSDAEKAAVILNILVPVAAIAVIAGTIAWYWPAREEARRAGAVSDEYITMRQRARSNGRYDPIRPEILCDARQDTLHDTRGKSRPARVTRVERKDTDA